MVELKEGYSRISGRSTRAADVDDIPRLAILDPEIGRSGSDELEGSRVMNLQNGLPLLVGHLIF